MIFPDVPDLPGVPAVPRLPGAVAPIVRLLVADALSFLSGLGEPPWGLFLDGVPVVTAESVVSFDLKKGAPISTFPIENGGFESYNKVQRPFDVRMRFATGGTPADRQALLESAAAAVNSLDLMDAVSPEAIYPSVNPTHFDYRRTSTNGFSLIVVDIFCEEVRVRAASTFTTSSSSTTSASAGGAAGSGAGGSAAGSGGGGGTAAAGTGGSTSTDISSSASATQSANFRDRFDAAGTIFSPKPASAQPLVNGGVVQPAPAGDQFSLSQALP